jgi:hypothetical protein
MSLLRLVWRHLWRAKYHDLTGDLSCHIQDALTRRRGL